jgi:hypothetical protein
MPDENRNVYAYDGKVYRDTIVLPFSDEKHDLMHELSEMVKNYVMEGVSYNKMPFRGIEAEKDGKRYEVFAATCGGDCFCAAIAIKWRKGELPSGMDYLVAFDEEARKILSLSTELLRKVVNKEITPEEAHRLNSANPKGGDDK